MDRFHTPAPTTVHLNSAIAISKWLAERRQHPDRPHPAIASIDSETIIEQIIWPHLRLWEETE